MKIDGCYQEEIRNRPSSVRCKCVLYVMCVIESKGVKVTVRRRGIARTVTIPTYIPKYLDTTTETILCQNLKHQEIHNSTLTYNFIENNDFIKNNKHKLHYL